MGERGGNAASDLLARVDLFEGLSRKELALVRECCRDESFAPGDVIVREGAPDKRFYLLISGTAEISVSGRVLKLLDVGDTFGEIGMLDGGPRTATVTAVTPVEALSLASFTLRSLLKEHPTIAIKMLEMLAARVRSLTGTGVG